MILAGRMPKPISVCAVVSLLASALACHTISEDDLVRRYRFERDSVRVELKINRDHTYTETYTSDGKNSEVNGTWKYWDGPRNLTLDNIWLPVVPLGSERVQLHKENFTFQVDPCGRTLCLGIDDDNELQLVGE